MKQIESNPETRPPLWLMAIFFTLLPGFTPLHADRILMIGDSWAWPVAPELQTVLHENGHTDMYVDATPWRLGAITMKSPDGLAEISTWLDERPDLTVVQMSVGNNDWNQTPWTPAWVGTEAEDNLIAGIVHNVEIIVDHIIALRPDMRILWSSYDFPRPVFKNNPVDEDDAPAEVNAFLIALTEKMSQFAMGKPGVDIVDINGALQVAFGFDGQKYTVYDPLFVIPAGDPSLPDSKYPSPLEPFLPNDSWHLTSAGWKALAQAQYDGYYAALLSGESFSINAGLNGNWWNGPARSGEGVQVEISDGGGGSQIMVATVYSYDTMGKQIFVITVGPVNGDTAEVEVFITEGGLWGDDFDPALVKESQWGTGTFSASSCDAMHMVLKPNAEYQAHGYTDLIYDLVRLTAPAAPCPVDNPN